MVKMSANARNWQKFTYYEFETSMRSNVRDTFFFFPLLEFLFFLFLTPLCHSSFTVEILYPPILTLFLSLEFLFPCPNTSPFSFFKFPSPPPSFTDSFHPLNFSFSNPLFHSPQSTPRSFFFFRIFPSFLFLLVKFS